MRRVIGIDIHRTFGELAIWENGAPRDEVVMEATGNCIQEMALAAVACVAERDSAAILDLELAALDGLRAPTPNELELIRTRGFKHGGRDGLRQNGIIQTNTQVVTRLIAASLLPPSCTDLRISGKNSERRRRLAGLIVVRYKSHFHVDEQRSDASNPTTLFCRYKRSNHRHIALLLVTRRRPHLLAPDVREQKFDHSPKNS